MAAAVAVAAFAAVLQIQMNDLREENGRLLQQMEDSQRLLAQQGQMVAVLAAADVQELDLRPTSAASQAVAVYYWSRASRRGFLVGNNLPPLQQGQVYQAWLVTDSRTPSAGTFEGWNGTAQLPMDLSTLDQPPKAIAVSIEQTGGSQQPSGPLILWGDLPSR